jgi:hypothetical protein
MLLLFFGMAFQFELRVTFRLVDQNFSDEGIIIIFGMFSVDVDDLDRRGVTVSDLWLSLNILQEFLIYCVSLR